MRGSMSHPTASYKSISFLARANAQVKWKMTMDLHGKKTN